MFTYYTQDITLVSENEKDVNWRGSIWKLSWGGWLEMVEYIKEYIKDFLIFNQQYDVLSLS